MNKINKTRNHDYNSLLKEIRPYVSFNYDLRKELKPHERRKIRQYHEVLKELTAHPHQIYRPRNKKNLKKVQKYSQNPTNLKGLKVAIVPNHDDKLKIRIKGDKVTARSDHIEIDNVFFDIPNLVTNPEKEIKRAVDSRPNSQYFTIMAGPHEIRRAADRGSIPNEVMLLMEEYKDETENNYFGNWLHGLISYRALNQNTDIPKHLNEKDKAAQRIQKERKNRKRRIKNMNDKIIHWQLQQADATTKKAKRELQKRIDKFKEEIGIQRSKL